MSREEQLRYIAELEKKVSLPEGGGNLRCYRRDYALSERGDRMRGFYSRADGHPSWREPPIRAGVYLRRRGYSIGVTDQGCGLLWVEYTLGNPEAQLVATCYPDFGDGTQRVVPAVHC